MRAKMWFVLAVPAVVLLPGELSGQAGSFHGGARAGGVSGGVPAARSFNSGAVQAPSSGGALKGPTPSGGAPAIRNFGGTGTPSVRSFSAPSTQGRWNGANSVGGGLNAQRSFSAPRTFSNGGASNLGNGSNRSSILPPGKLPSRVFQAPNYSGRTQQQQVNRPDFDNGRNDSFIRNQDINNRNANHWTHNHGNWNNWNNNWWGQHRHNNTVVVWPWFGLTNIGLWGGWGWPYYGWGYGYGYPLYATNNFGWGYPYSSSYIANYWATAPANGAAVAQANAAPAPANAAGASDEFPERGEADFKAGNYQAAARDWQHALVDDPKNGGLMMLMAQALFAAGQYEEAAGATQAGMQMLPEDKWGVVIQGYQELYGNAQDYTDQIRALEKARDEKPDSPAVRFLLGFQFGYLGYPKQAVTELDKGLKLAPQDMGALKVRQIFAAKWPGAPAVPAAAVEAARQFEKQQNERGAAPPARQPPPGAAPVPRPGPVDAEAGTPS